MVRDVSKMLIAIFFLFFLSGCGYNAIVPEGNGQEQAYKKVAQAAVKSNFTTQQAIDFSWVEKAYDGILVGATYPIGTAMNVILSKELPPIEVGSYEGGDYYQFENVTYFAHPIQEEVVAIARPIIELNLTVLDVKKALGNPDVEELNEMEGFGMMEYTIGGNRLMFEFTEDTVVHYVWLHQNFEEND